MRHISGIFVFTVFFTINLSAAVFQYTVPVTTSRGKSEVFLWIPAQARQVRGLVIAGMTLMERECVRDDRIRKVCYRQQLAIVFSW